MRVDHARCARVERYDRWYGLLLEEINLVAPNGAVVAVGNLVASYLEQRGFARPFTRVIHYSSQAGLARRVGIKGHEESFKGFLGSVSLDDLVDTAKQVLGAARVPPRVRDESLSRLVRSQLTRSRQELIFNYKLAFESMRA